MIFTRFLLLLAFIIVLISCREKKQYSNAKDVLYTEGNHIVRKVFFDTGEVGNVIKYYSLDTTANGPEIHYYRNNNVERWKWFKKGQKYLQYAVYYDINGKYMYQKGIPFLNAINWGGDTLVIELANPPNINYVFAYKVLADQKLVRSLVQEPGKTDTTSWATIPNHKFVKGQKYFVYFYIVDNNKKILDSISQELFP